VPRPLDGLTDATAEHQWIGGETVVVPDRAGHGGQADLVAVVGDASDHALTDAPGMQRAGRQ
jgi:hypothetical protein